MARDRAEPERARQDAPSKRRLFYALWADQATRRRLERATRTARRQCGGRPVPVANLHVTLAFLGGLPALEVEAARALALPRSPGFDLRLDRFGYLERSRILWLAPSVVPAELAALEGTLWERLGALGFEREPRPFRPHLTLCRRARAVSLAPPEVVWRVERFALVESLPATRGSRYEPLVFWPLG